MSIFNINDINGLLMCINIRNIYYNIVVFIIYQWYCLIYYSVLLCNYYLLYSMINDIIVCNIIIILFIIVCVRIIIINLFNVILMCQ